MKIGKTSKGNIKIVMSEEQVRSLHLLLDRMDTDDIKKFVNFENTDDICYVWSALEDYYSKICE